MLFVSCQKDDLLKNISEDIAKPETYGLKTEGEEVGFNYAEPRRIIIGEKLPNPYSVTNMQAAFDYYNAHIDNSQFEEKIVSVPIGILKFYLLRKNI